MRVRLLIRKPSWLPSLPGAASGGGRGGSRGGRQAGGRPRRRMTRDPRKERLRRQITKAVVGVALVGTLFALLGDGGVMTLLGMRARAAELSVKVNEAERHNEQLRDRIRALKEDPQAIEKLAREELGMARSGETIYLLPERPPDADGDVGFRVPELLEPSTPTGPSLSRRR